jgi:hypothetical protein
VPYFGNAGFITPSHSHEYLSFVERIISLALDESFTFGETLEKTKYIFRTQDEDPFVISELVDPVKILVRDFAESFTIGETLTNISNKFRSLAESFTITGTAAASKIKSRSLAESFTISNSYIYDTFASTYDITTDAGSGSASCNTVVPDGLWRVIYRGYNPNNVLEKGQDGVRVPSVAPPDGSTNVYYAYPYTTTNTTNTTNANLTLTESAYFGNFDVSFYMRTINQKKTTFKKEWEVAWFMWHFNEAGYAITASGAHFHHYYVLLKTTGKIELGRKDTISGVDFQYFIDSATGSYGNEPTFTYVQGQWYKCRISQEGNHIRFWLDDVLKVDAVDDGTWGTPNTDTHDGAPPHPPSSYMYSGKFGFYTEDAEVEYTALYLYPNELTRVVNKIRSLAESFTMTDTLTRAMVKLRSFISVESFTIIGTASAAKVKAKDLTETVTFGEALTRLSLKARALAESFTTGHSVSRATIKSRAPGFPETFTIGEALTKIKTSTKSLAESLSIGETLTRIATKTRTLAESFSITDLAQRGKAKAISFTEAAIVFTGTPTFIKNSIRSLAESFTIGESLTRITSKARSFAESFTISEALTKSAISFRSAAESFTIADALTIIRTKTRILAETITFSDAVTRTRQFVKSLTEAFSITDSPIVAKIKGRLINESFTIGEFVSAIRLLAGAPRWIISGQVSDFQDSIENLVKAYVNSNWTLATPALGTNTASQAQIDKFAYDGFRTYYIKVREIASDVQTRRIRFNTYEFETPIEFDLFSRRLSKGEAYSELNAMINELLRIFGTYQHESMFGVQGILFDRITPLERERSAAQTVWSRRLTIRLFYYKTSTVG